MIRGMTGHASLVFSTDGFDAEIEIRSVNSRYLDVRLKAPSQYAVLEIEARRIVVERLGRGKVDISLRISEKPGLGRSFLFNRELARDYVEAGRKFAEEIGIPSEISLREILSLPGVLNNDYQQTDESFSRLIIQKLHEAIDLMLPMMITEGKSTVDDTLNSLAIMERSLVFIKERYPESLQKYRDNLRERIFEISAVKPEKERLTVEIELFASRTAINEELVRLENHIKVMKEILSQERRGLSKELDFVAQELNREVNTIGSKSSDFEIIEHTIIMKSEIEKMREQFRNIV